MFTEALELFQEAVDKDPLVGTSWENLGVISMRMGLHEKAKFSLIKAKSILGDSSASVKINLAALKEHLGSTDDLDDGSGYEAEEIIDPALAGQLTSEAISKAENGDEEGALQAFAAAKNANPLNPKLWENLGVIQMRMGLLNDAEESFVQAKSRGGGDDSLEANHDALQAHLRHRAKHRAGGERSVRPSVAVEVGGEDGWMDGQTARKGGGDVGRVTNAAIKQAESGDLVGALTLFKLAVKMDPAGGSAHENLGVTQMRLGLLAAARESFMAASAHGGNVDRNLEALAGHEDHARENGHDMNQMYAKYLLESDDDYEEEEEEEEEVVHAAVHSARASELTEMAIQKIDASDLEAALQLFEEAARESPNVGLMWENLGVTQMRLNQLDEAAESFKRARTLDKSISDENLVALQEHLDYRAQTTGRGGIRSLSEEEDEIGRFSDKGKASSQASSKATSAIGLPERGENAANDEDFVVDLARPLGARLTPAARVESVTAGGQLAQAGVAPGDRIVAAGTSTVYTLRHFKSVLAEHKENKFNKLVVTFRKNRPLDTFESEASRDEGLCDDGDDVQSVQIGDQVQVRNTGDWLSGLVREIDSATGFPKVSIEGSEEESIWDECRVVEPREASGEASRDIPTAETSEGPREEILWDSERDDTPPSFPGAEIFVPEEVSKISRFTVPQAKDRGKCGFESFLAAFDRKGDLLLGAVDDFFADAVVKDLVSRATAPDDPAKPTWLAADIHRSTKHPDDIAKGNGFPGLRRDYVAGTRLVTDCLDPVLALLDIDFDLFRIREAQNLFGLLVPMEGHGSTRWLDSQRLPHNDIRWELGTSPKGDVPKSFASVLPLTSNFQRSGTGVWRERSSGYSLLKTVDTNEAAQGNMNPHVERHLHPEIDLYSEVPDPSPQALTSHAWAECVMLAYLRFNRFVFYDGRRLHQQYLDNDDFERLSKDPKKGRLTMNSFFWQTSS